MLRSRILQRSVVSTITKKKTTGIVGLAVSSNPRKELASLYSRILHLTERFPTTSILAQSAASIASTRLEIVKDNEDLEKIEELIGLGQMEELIQQAQDEIDLLPAMLEARVFDPLETIAPKGQWDSFANTTKV